MRVALIMISQASSYIFLWENFGPMHADRCDAVAKSGLDVVGLELFSQSDTYDWVPEKGDTFEKITLFGQNRPRGLKLIWALIKFRFKQKKSTWFLCHYNWIEILFFACFLRLIGDKVFTMGDSKFDDYPRYAWREIIKRMFLAPYQGAIGCGTRSKDYLRFLGIPNSKIATEYDTLSIQRIQKQAILAGNRDIPLSERHFTIIARHVPKKNIPLALNAYAQYCALVAQPAELHLCGSGFLENQLRDLAKQLGIADKVIFKGFIQTEQISEALSSSLALILPSSEEQFGLVVIEALAMRVPVLLSTACGARDKLVRTGVNGFVFEPDNAEGLAWFMSLIAHDEALWQRMRLATEQFVSHGDVSNFVSAVNMLTKHEQ